MPIDESELREVFKVGDIVRLNSGGPAMVVIAVHKTGDVGTIFFDRSGIDHTSCFPDIALHHVKPGVSR